MKVNSEEQLKELAERDGYILSKKQAQKIYNYIQLLIKWSETHNLVGPAAKNRLYEDHLSECLWIDEVIQKGDRMADFGTGAGLPGIILACLNISIEMDLIDSNQKKTRFLNMVAQNIGLNNVKILNEKVQIKNKWSGASYPIIVSRAAGKIMNLLHTVTTLARQKTLLYAMIGKDDLERMSNIEKDAISMGWKNIEVLEKTIHGKSKGIAVFKFK